jgi:hypothetical protein
MIVGAATALRHEREFTRPAERLYRSFTELERMRKPKYCGAFAVAFWMGFSRLGVADVAVHGEAGLLPILRKAQATAESAFPHGRLSWRYSEKRGDVRTEAYGTVLWSGELSRWSYQSRQSDADGVMRFNDDGGGEPVTHIRSHREYFQYLPDYRYAVRSPHLSHGLPSFNVLPKQAWFHDHFAGEGRKWSEMLDPALPDRWCISMTLEREGDNTVTITRRYRDGIPSYMTSAASQPDPERDRVDDLRITRRLDGIPDYVMSASLHFGGLVTGFRRAAMASGTDEVLQCSESCRLEWEPVGDGRFWLRRREQHREHARRSDLFIHSVLEVTDFDPDPEIPDDAFTFEGLHLPPGTPISDQGNVHPARPQTAEAILQAELDDLSKLLRNVGLGAAERDRDQD